jgi:PIN domain nuclease of toxin-antitoxin system
VIADASVCAINQAEVISHFVYLGALLDDVRAMLGALPMLSSQRTTRLPGKPQLTRSNRIGRIVVRRSVLLALAKRLGAPAYAADKAWKDIASDAGAKVVVIC